MKSGIIFVKYIPIVCTVNFMWKNTLIPGKSFKYDPQRQYSKKKLNNPT